MALSPESPLAVPNLLSLSRLPLAVALFACIAWEVWWLGLTVFLLASLTDWLDGWWARRYHSLSLLGRSLDPLTDKVIVCGAFVYLMPIPAAGLSPWMVALVVCREVFVTGLRGIVEAAGIKFGADHFGKLKMLLQCIWLIALLSSLSFSWDGAEASLALRVVLWAVLAATLGSGLQYFRKAAVALGRSRSRLPNPADSVD